MSEPTLEAAGTALEEARAELSRVVIGQKRMLDRIMVALLADGHCLLEGVPGLGKTLTLATLARVLGGSFARIQFTPDLLPADIVGTRVYRASLEKFDVEPGPIMANFVLADEINRAPAKVQAAMLEAMAERQVTIGDRTFDAPRPFLVMATQNPVESEGVYPLPEAQRDRFLMRVPVDYPRAASGAGDPPPGGGWDRQALGLDRVRRQPARFDSPDRVRASDGSAAGTGLRQLPGRV
jgi:MoxR-like ATPase